MGCEFPAVEDHIAQEVLYSGRVQGVGFRQSVYSLACKQCVRGYVQNLDNGKVRLVASGETTQVKNFLRSVESLWADNISKIQVSDFQSLDIPAGFSVRY